VVDVLRKTKKGAPPCGLYIKVKNNGKNFTLIENLKKVCLGINSSPYEENMHVFEYTGKIPHTKEGLEDRKYIIALKNFIQSQGIIFIIREDIELAHEIKADGVIVTTFAGVRKAREIMNKKAIVGIRIPASRKKLAKALEENVDFVGIPMNKKTEGIILDLLNWWSVRTKRPCLIEGNISNNDCKYLVQFGAMFIDSGHYIFKHPSGPLQGVVNMLYAIELALPSQAIH
jgi:thiamine monophosphate synthase